MCNTGPCAGTDMRNRCRIGLKNLPFASGSSDSDVSILQRSAGTHYAWGITDCGRWRTNLRPNNDRVERILTQLTAARWHLDQAVGGEPEAARRNIETARRTYDHILQMLRVTAMTAEEQRRVRRELSELLYRLQAIEDK
jgi:hypothetical protein